MRRLFCLCFCATALCWNISPGSAQSGMKSATKAAAPKDDSVRAKDPGGRYALLVGVEQYVHPKLTPLKFSVDDVSSLADVLKESGYEVTLLTDETGKQDPSLAPTKSNFDTRLQRILTQCKTQADKIILAFAGHGLQFEGQKDAYFCPQDARPFADESNTLISISKVYADLDRSFAGVKIVLVDACRNDPDPGRGRGIEADLIPPPKGIATLFSCSSGERAFESDALKHGVFFHHVLEGLKGKAASANGDITFYGLTDHVCTAVPSTMTSLFPGKQQQPNFKADIAGTPPVLARIANSTNPAKTAPATPRMPSGMLDKLTEDFRTTPNKSLPEGWVNLKESPHLFVRQDRRAQLRTFDGENDWDNSDGSGPEISGKVRLPPVTLWGDFYFELSVLNNDRRGQKKRSLAVTLKGEGDDSLVLRCTEEPTGYVVSLSNSEDSQPFKFAGISPTPLRLERSGGAYRITCDSRVILTHDAKDHRRFNFSELELSPKLVINSVKLGPLTKSDINKPGTKKKSFRK